jgi:hypothetical protein
MAEIITQRNKGKNHSKTGLTDLHNRSGRLVLLLTPTSLTSRAYRSDRFADSAAPNTNTNQYMLFRLAQISLRER